MKKMKKIAATLLCIGVAISTLCACSSTGNGGEQPVEEPTTKQTEAVTEATETTTEATTTTTEETTEAQAGDVIIYLYDYWADVKNMPPEKVASDFYNTIAPYMPLSTVTEDADANMTVYRLTIDGVPQASFILGNGGDSSTEVEVYLCISTAGASTTSFNTSTGNSSIDFIPLFYNQTKKCLVGYSGYNSSNPGFSEAYWDDVLRTSITVPVDPSLYGF